MLYLYFRGGRRLGCFSGRPLRPALGAVEKAMQPSRSNAEKRYCDIMGFSEILQVYPDLQAEDIAEALRYAKESWLNHNIFIANYSFFSS